MWISFIKSNEESLQVSWKNKICLKESYQILTSWNNKICTKDTLSFDANYGNEVCLIEQQTFDSVWTNNHCLKDTIDYNYAWSNLKCIKEELSYQINWSNNYCIKDSVGYYFVWSDAKCAKDQLTYNADFNNQICLLDKIVFDSLWTQTICFKEEITIDPNNPEEGNNNSNIPKEPTRAVLNGSIEFYNDSDYEVTIDFLTQETNLNFHNQVTIQSKSNAVITINNGNAYLNEYWQIKLRTIETRLAIWTGFNVTNTTRSTLPSNELNIYPNNYFDLNCLASGILKIENAPIQ